MPDENIKCLRDLYHMIRNKKKEIIPVSEIWTLYNKYNEYHNCQGHQNSRQSRDSYHKDHKILYFLLEKLYLAQCTDLNLISKVIKRIYAEGLRFNILVSHLFNESKKFETDEIIPMFEYCLKYTYMKKTLFNGRRMASIECFFPALMLPENYYSSHLPVIMRILLQYGLFLDPITGEAPTVHDINDDTGSNDARTEDHNFAVNLLWGSILNEGIIKINPLFLPINELPDERKEVVNICLEIANMFMRSSLNIRISIFLLPLRRLEWYSTSQHTHDFHRTWHKSTTDIVNFIQRLGRFIPQLPRRCLEPMSLRHSCKRIIRKLLHLNWNLPNGIFNLNLPMPLVQYLNLEID